LSKKISKYSLLPPLFALCLCLVLVYLTTSAHIRSERLAVERFILERGTRINDAVTDLLYKTRTIASFVELNGGDTEDFPALSAILLGDPAIVNFLIAPQGVVTEVYPLVGNEALLGLDFFLQETVLGEGERSSGSILLANVAKETRQLVFGGPFTAVQGGEILISRMPVFLYDENGDEYFWGVVGVTLHFPEVLDGAGLKDLELMGYYYEVLQLDTHTGEPQVILSSDSQQTRW